MPAGQEVKVSHLLDEGGLSSFQIKLLIWSLFIVLIDGYDIAAIAFSAPYLVQAWGLERGALGPVSRADGRRRGHARHPRVWRGCHPHVFSRRNLKSVRPGLGGYKNLGILLNQSHPRSSAGLRLALGAGGARVGRAQRPPQR